MDTVGIIGIGTHFPTTIETAADLAPITDIPEPILREKMGIVQRHVAGEADTITAMASYAAEAAIKEAGIAPEAIDLVISHGSQHKDHLVWNSGAKIQHNIGAVNAYSFEMYALCAGAPIALNMAKTMMLGDPSLKTVLLAAGSRENELINFKNQRSRFMFNFGSGGGAMILRRGATQNLVLGSAAFTDGSLSETVILTDEAIPEGEADVVGEVKGRLDVTDADFMASRLDETTMDNFLKVMREALEKSNATFEDVKFLGITHMKKSFYLQILEAIGLTPEQSVYLDHYGHVQSIDQAIAIQLGVAQGKIKAGDLILLAGAGTGYTWSAGVIQWGECIMIRAEDWVAFHADRTPEKTVFIDQYLDRTFSYADLHQRVDRLTGYLKAEWDVQEGDVLAILAKNCIEYYEFQFACMRLGAIMLPLNWRLAIPEMLFIINDSSAKGIIYDTECADKISALIEKSSLAHTLRIDLNQAPVDDNPAYDDALARQIDGVPLSPSATHDTVVTIMYTSGTTGHPKGVLITHGMTFWNAINISVPTGINQDSVYYVILPTFHTAGLNLYANPIIHYGGTNIVAREFDPELTLNTLANDELGVTHFFGVPAIYLFLSQHPKFDGTDLSRIQSWGCGGAPCPVTLLEKYAARDIIIQLGFGMTETSPTVFLIDKKRALVKPESVGKPLLHTRVRVVDDQMYDVAVGDVGEVVIAGPNITPGYHNRPDANEENFTLDEYDNRWLHSGDAGMVDEEGCIYIVDRYKDMYISGGENVYPAEVEQVLFKIEGVADAAVIGVPDDKWGEVGMAILVMEEDYAIDEDKFTSVCVENLAKYKVPKKFATIDEIPRNAAGKVLKRVLREQFIEQQST